MTGRANPLPGLTGLGSGVLPGLISPTATTTTAILLAGTSTTGRWNSADKNASITLSNSDRTATSVAPATYQGVRGTVAINTATEARPCYAEFVLDHLGGGGSDVWRVGFGNATVSLTDSTGGEAWWSGSLATNRVANRNFNNTGTNGKIVSNNWTVATTNTVQIMLFGTRVWFGYNGTLSGMDVSKLGLGSTNIGNCDGYALPAGTYYLFFSFGNTSAQVSIPTTTAYAAPPGAFVY